MICSLIIGIGSFGRIGIFAGSPRGVAEAFELVSGAVLIGPTGRSARGEGPIGNLNSDKAAEGVFGELREPMPGVFGTVDAPEGRWNGEPRSGGYDALYRGEVGVLKGRWGCEATASQRYEVPCSYSECHQPDLGPDMTEPRETIWRLADRPWPRLGREEVEPALLVA